MYKKKHIDDKLEKKRMSHARCVSGASEIGERTLQLEELLWKRRKGVNEMTIALGLSQVSCDDDDNDLCVSNVYECKNRKREREEEKRKEDYHIDCI